MNAQRPDLSGLTTLPGYYCGTLMRRLHSLNPLQREVGARVAARILETAPKDPAADRRLLPYSMNDDASEL
jgi:hypothetical protein